jgi:hypothetical protein
MEQMAATKLQDEEEARAQQQRNQQNTSNYPESQNFREASMGNNTSQFSAITPLLHTKTQTKRPRMESATMDITMEESLRAGPAGQASHTQ